jgi:(p)ppGpp synthase/HD superfamily hydrolase
MNFDAARRIRSAGVHQHGSDSPTLADADRFLVELYRHRRRRRGRGVDHPRAVAALLAADGQPPTIVLAGLLHDSLEDCELTTGELEQRFGPQVATLVAALTENPAIERYADRKAALRRQTIDAGRAAAVIALADKLAKVQDSPSAPRRRKLVHYRATLEQVEARYGPDRLSLALRRALDRWPDPARG